MHRLRRVFILVLGLALVAAACGNGDSDAETDTTAAPTTTAASSEPFAPDLLRSRLSVLLRRIPVVVGTSRVGRSGSCLRIRVRQET